MILWALLPFISWRRALKNVPMICSPQCQVVRRERCHLAFPHQAPKWLACHSGKRCCSHCSIKCNHQYTVWVISHFLWSTNTALGFRRIFSALYWRLLPCDFFSPFAFCSSYFPWISPSLKCRLCPSLQKLQKPRCCNSSIIATRLEGTWLNNGLRKDICMFNAEGSTDWFLFHFKATHLNSKTPQCWLMLY